MSGPRPQRSTYQKYEELTTHNAGGTNSYTQKALQQIRNSIQPFATSEGGSTSSGVSSVGSSAGPPSSSPNRQSPSHSSTRGIEYRAQQYPFVPSQVPASVQQLLRRIDSPSSPSSSSSNSPTSQLQPVIKKPTLVIKSTIVPKPVLQTAVPYSLPLPAKPYSASPPPLPPKPNKKPKAEININRNVDERRNSLTTTTTKDVFDPANSNNLNPNNRVSDTNGNTTNGMMINDYDKNRLIVSDIVNEAKNNSNFLSSRFPSTKFNNNNVVVVSDEDGRTSESRNSDSMIYGSVEEFKGGPNSETPSEVDSEIIEVTGTASNGNGLEPTEIHTHESPIPVRKKLSREKEEERFESKVRVYSPQAFKFFMEQHVENVIKSHQERMHRRMQLESEMAKIRLSDEAQTQMRKMLNQKESNYIRLKRAKMDKSLFKQIRVIGVGAFGEVALVRKLDTQHLYAMKTLRKSDVLRRNQVAHVKAERDILAEADNEWVVKLYYSFQDLDHLYFVMDYIPGGDLMSLLIKKGIFEEPLSQFYIAELTCAVESVHKMGFIHRDIKPDNILIDRDGHIKLTDFGLCTGFRWTHNSRYYQESGIRCQCNGSLKRGNNVNFRQMCGCEDGDKPLERRRKTNVRCLAHSLVGTPNYIAPEVLRRTGYTQLCDWWSVGVILYEMLVGQPPFLAPTPAETQYKVINWASTLHIPSQSKLSNPAMDLILKLCTDQTNRLGKGGAHQVKSHQFFKSVDFEAGLRRSSAPFVPEIRFPTDTSNFDPCDGDKQDDTETSPYESNQFHGFFEFTFRRFFDDAYNEDGGPVYV